MTRRPLWLGATLTIAALTAMTTSAGAATAQRSADPIVIGLVANQTGFMQAYDDPPSQGVELAVATSTPRRRARPPAEDRQVRREDEARASARPERST